MKLSIVTVTYNAGKLLIPTLDSIVKQNIDDMELLVMDGQSVDETLQIANSYCYKISNVKIVSEPDNGIYDAMNKGIDLAQGDYILFLNAGDVLFDETVLKRILPILNGKDIFYGDSFTMNKNVLTPFRMGAFSKYRLAMTNICHQTIFYPRNVLLRNKYNLKYKILADYAINLFLWKEYSFIYLDTPIALYLGGGTSAINKDEKFVSDYKWIILRTLGIDAFLYLCFRKVFCFIFK